MHQELADFLSNKSPVVEEQATWGDLALCVSCYLTNELPPLEYVTSARALVFRGDDVLVMTNPEETHIWPGGRLEAGETPEEALQRELLEETGWTVSPREVLGLIRFHVLSALPDGYRYPYPDFVQVVYRAEAADYRAEARMAGDYEREAIFVPLSEVRTLGLTACQHAFLERAARARSQF